MERFFGRRVEKIFRLAELAERDAERLALAVFPRLLLEIVRRYLRVEVVGLENVPRRGRAIVAPNHSGAMGFDAIVLGHVLNREIERIPRILTFWQFFEMFPAFSPLARKVGWVEASTESGMSILRKNQLLILFPEGEGGSWKPSSQAYRLQRFRTGFVRMALLTRSPIVPCVIIGAEETHINLGTLKLSRYIRGLQIPVPLNILPLPAKWTIRFLEPLDFSGYAREAANSKEAMDELAGRVQARMQEAIRGELKARPYVYIPKTP